MKKIFTLFSLLALSVSTMAQDFTFGATDVSVSILNDDMNIPWNVDWGPDNMLWITDGPRIKRMNPKTGEYTVVWTSPRRLLGKPSGNGLGFTFHPDFLNNGEVFLALDTGIYYKDNIHIEVTKLTYSFKNDTLLNPEVLFTYQTSGEHCGARMITTQDDKIMITTPDYWYGLPENSLQGRVLKFNTDGSPAEDNPFGDYTYSYGHRNAQGLLQTPNGKIYVSEHGQWSMDQDELNLILAGENYGWPAYDGFMCSGMANDSCSSPTFSHIPPIDGGRNPPGGIDYYNHPAIPEFNNAIIEAVLGGGGMIVFNLSADGNTVENKTTYLNPAQAGFEFNRFRDVCTGPDGKIYAITNDRGNLDYGPWPDRNEMDSDAKIRVIQSKDYDHCTPTSSIQYHTICNGESILINGIDYTESQNVIEETTNAGGCDSLVIHVIEKFPSFHSILPTQEICSGESVIVLGQEFSDAGVQLIEYETINGCDSVYEFELIVHDVNTNVELEENVLTAEEELAVYQWLNCPDMTIIPWMINQSYAPSSNGIYAVQITNSLGCIDTSDCIDVIISSTSEQFAEKINIYPNPIQNELIIQSDIINNSDVSILDISGKTIYNSTMDLSSKTVIDFQNFSKGIYLIKVINNNKTYTTKVTK